MSVPWADDAVEALREAGFDALLLGGATLVALGVAFLAIGVGVNTAPPAPYVSPQDRVLLIAGSALAIVVGLVLVRLAGRTVGW